MTGQMSIFDYIKPGGDLETALLTGSLFHGGKLRIFALYRQEPDARKRVDFLKREYGCGGRTVDFSTGRRGYIDFSPKEVRLAYFGESAADDQRYKWEEAEKCIKKLIETGMYMDMDDMDEWAQLEAEYQGSVPYPKPRFGWPDPKRLEDDE